MPAELPQNILDALTGLKADVDDAAATDAAAQAAQKALANATHDAEKTATEASGAQAKLAADRESAKKLIDATFVWPPIAS